MSLNWGSMGEKNVFFPLFTCGILHELLLQRDLVLIVNDPRHFARPQVTTKL